MSAELRGYQTRNKRVSVGTTGREFLPEEGRQSLARVRIRNLGANELRIFWTPAELATGTHYITMATGAAAETFETENFPNLISITGANLVEITYFFRRS